MIYFLIVSFVFTGSSFAQTGTVAGKVTDVHTQAPLLNTNVVLVGTKLGAAADASGEFIITKVPAGDYKIKAMYISYESTEKAITVKADEEVQVDFNLREDFFQTDQVIVTATRTQKLMEDVPVVTELITRAEIEEKGAEDLSEILEDRPGISIETGTTGGNFLYMNGVDSRRILILVDNVPLSGRLNNRIQLNLIDSDNIDHVEIVKGPGSSLYGNDAMGGVINIITKGYPDAFKVQANGRYGSNDLYSGNFSFSGENKNISYLLNFDHLKRGFGKGASEIDVTDTKATSINSKFKFRNLGIGDLEFKGEYREDEQNSESMFMGSANKNTANIKNFNSSLVWQKGLTEKFNAKVTGYYTDNLRTYQSAATNSNRPASVDTTTDNIFGIKSDFKLAASEKVGIDFGFDFSENDYENERLTSTQTRRQIGVFTQVETNLFKKLNLTVGGRYDKITDVKGYFSPRISAMYTFNSDLKLRGSWGRGFRAPSFIELYSDFPIPIPGMPLKVVGNPDLLPERSFGGNFGVEYFINSFMLMNVTYFQNKFEDMIVDYQAAPLTYSYLNVESATFQGIELQTRFYILNNLTTTVSYNYTDINQKNEDVAFSKISPHTAYAKVNYSLLKNKLKVSLRNQFLSKRDILVVHGYTGDFTKAKKDAYNLLDLTLSYNISKLLTLRVGATNLTDYVDEDYGPYIGRSYFLGINTTFQKGN
ncbi:TonB-dependent receptor [candidate division KSB1 bacterium]|nr:TonB-dependent receptor [candidate division KSB1 bacterium]